MAQLVSDIIIVHINFPMVIISQNITHTYHDCRILILRSQKESFNWRNAPPGFIISLRWEVILYFVIIAPIIIYTLDIQRIAPDGHINISINQPRRREINKSAKVNKLFEYFAHYSCNDPLRPLLLCKWSRFLIKECCWLSYAATSISHTYVGHSQHRGKEMFDRSIGNWTDRVGFSRPTLQLHRIK